MRCKLRTYDRSAVRPLTICNPKVRHLWGHVMIGRVCGCMMS
jgi:hypothetical protein